MRSTASWTTRGSVGTRARVSPERFPGSARVVITHREHGDVPAGHFRIQLDVVVLEVESLHCKRGRANSGQVGKVDLGLGIERLWGRPSPRNRSNNHSTTPSASSPSPNPFAVCTRARTARENLGGRRLRKALELPLLPLRNHRDDAIPDETWCQATDNDNPFVSTRTTSCAALRCPALRCPALPCPALPCPARPCPALPRPALLRALPCPALLPAPPYSLRCPAPCPALPCPAPLRCAPYQSGMLLMVSVTWYSISLPSVPARRMIRDGSFFTPSALAAADSLNLCVNACARHDACRV